MGTAYISCIQYCCPVAHYMPKSFVATRMATGAAQAVHVVCLDGDLLLQAVGNGKEGLLLVSSQVLAKASTSFSRLPKLRCRPATQPCASTNQVRVTEDDEDALLMICNILHGRKHRLPETLPLDVLKEIALSCARHKLMDALSAWSLKWLTHVWITAEGKNIYTIIAIALDLGFSPALDENNAYRSFNLFRSVDQRIAGADCVTIDFSPILKTNSSCRWLRLSKNTDNDECCCGSSKCFVGCILHITRIP